MEQTVRAVRKIDQTLPPDMVAMIDAFVRRQEAKGIRSLRKIPYWLSVYCLWLIDRGLSVADMSPFAAEEFQTFLVTTENAQGLCYATKTVSDIVAVVDRFHAWLVETGAVRANPFYRMPRVKEPKNLPRDIPTVAELHEGLEGLRTFWKAPTIRERRQLYRLHVIAELLYATGMRLNELAHLVEDDIDWDHRIVHIRVAKGGLEREAYLSEYAAMVLRIYVTSMREAVNRYHDSATLFGCADAHTMDQSLNRRLKATFGFTSHTFRHTVGTHLLKAGCDLRFIQLILGHEDLDSTAVYTKVSKEDLRGQLDAFHPRGGAGVAQGLKRTRGK